MKDPNPEIYMVFPPTGDWVMRKPASEKGDNGLVFSPASTIPAVQSAIEIIGQSASKTPDGFMPDEEIAFDFEKLPAEGIHVALEGASIITSQTQHLPREMRKPAIDFLRAFKGPKPAVKKPETTEADNSPAKPKRSAIRKELREQKAEEARLEHEQARQQELEALLAWQEEHPAHGQNYFVTAQGFVKTAQNRKGKVTIISDDGLDQHMMAYIQMVKGNPELLQNELKDTHALKEFFAETDEFPLLSAILDHTSSKTTDAWADEYYRNSPEIKEGYTKWLAIFGNFPENFWRLCQDSEGLTDRIIEEHPELYDSGTLRIYGTEILRKSFVKLAESQPEDFINLLHELANETMDTEEEDLIRNFFIILSRAIKSSDSVAAVITNTPIATGISDETRLKGADLKLAMFKTANYDEQGVYGYGEYGRKISSQLREMYDRRKASALEHGIPFNSGSFSKKLYEKSFFPLLERIKEGALADSLYLRIHAQTQSDQRVPS